MIEIINILGKDEHYNLKLASTLKRKYEREGKITYIVYSDQNYRRYKLALPSAQCVIIVGMQHILPDVLVDTGARTFTTLRGD